MWGKVVTKFCSSNQFFNMEKLAALLIPGYILYQHSSSTQSLLQPNQISLVENCTMVCSFLQQIPCSAGQNCSLRELCRRKEAVEKCEHDCVETMWQFVKEEEEDKEMLEIMDPENDCFQHSK